MGLVLLLAINNKLIAVTLIKLLSIQLDFDFYCFHNTLLYMEYIKTYQTEKS